MSSNFINTPEYQDVFNRIKRAVSSVPARVAVLAVNFSKERFVKKNWLDVTPEPWTTTRKRKGSTLVSSGRLKRSVRKISVSPSRVVIGTDVPYAQMHNEGGVISGTERVGSHRRKAHRRKRHIRKGKTVKATMVKSYTVKSYSRKYNRKFKKRQFIGQSQNLCNRIEELIKKELDKAIVRVK